MKVIEFKTISPFYEQERDGIKPFTVRKWDGKDKRFRALAQSRHRYGVLWAIKITNPANGETFMRGLKDYRYLSGTNWEWVIIDLGERVEL